MLHLVGLLSSYFAHDARSQEPKAEWFGLLLNFNSIVIFNFLFIDINIVAVCMAKEVFEFVVRYTGMCRTLVAPVATNNVFAHDDRVAKMEFHVGLYFG